MDMKTAVIYRLEELIRQKDITVNEAAIRSGVPPSTLKNILYGQSNVTVYAGATILGGETVIEEGRTVKGNDFIYTGKQRKTNGTK